MIRLRFLRKHNCIISKIFESDRISDEEVCSLILFEIEKYRKMMEDLRLKSKNTISEESKQSFLNKGREKVINFF